MKQILCALFAVLLLIGCSDDDELYFSPDEYEFNTGMITYQMVGGTTGSISCRVINKKDYRDYIEIMNPTLIIEDKSIAEIKDKSNIKCIKEGFTKVRVQYANLYKDFVLNVFKESDIIEPYLIVNSNEKNVDDYMTAVPSEKTTSYDSQKNIFSVTYKCDGYSYIYKFNVVSRKNMLSAVTMTFEKDVNQYGFFIGLIKSKGSKGWSIDFTKWIHKISIYDFDVEIDANPYEKVNQMDLTELNFVERKKVS